MTKTATTYYYIASGSDTFLVRDLVRSQFTFRAEYFDTQLGKWWDTGPLELGMWFIKPVPEHEILTWKLTGKLP